MSAVGSKFVICVFYIVDECDKNGNVVRYHTVKERISSEGTDADFIDKMRERGAVKIVKYDTNNKFIWEYEEPL